MIFKNSLKTFLMAIALVVLFSFNAFPQQQTAGPVANNNGQQTPPPPATAGGTTDNTVVKDPNTYEDGFDYGQLQKIPHTPDKKSYEETLYRVSLNTMEEGGDWLATFPFDYGKVTVAMRDGTPEGIKGAPAAVNQVADPSGKETSSTGYFISKQDDKSRVLGVKVNFFGGRKTSPWLRIDAVQPIPLSGIVKGFEVWVSGRELKHDLYIIVEDSKGKEQLVSMGKLNFLGWRKMTAPVPTYIDQQDPHNPEHRGLTFKGFYIKFDMLDATGNYFIYFDNLAAQVSRYLEENLLKDDVRDSW